MTRPRWAKDNIWQNLSADRRDAIRAAGLRAKGKVIKRELLEDPKPSDLIRLPEVAKMAGLVDTSIRTLRHRGSPHPLPPEYMRMANPTRSKSRQKYVLCWQRQQIIDWVAERKAVAMYPIVLNWYEIYQLRKLLDGPQYGVAKQVKEVLKDALELGKEEEDE